MILNTADIPNLYDNEERLEIIEKVASLLPDRGTGWGRGGEEKAGKRCVQHFCEYLKQFSDNCHSCDFPTKN